MPSSIPHQKFCFYHLPTRGRAGIKLGDAWYVSNVSIILIVPCYYILCFGCLMGFIIHFYIIFGTNLLTGGPAQNYCFFCLFQCFEETEYQTESKWNETFGIVIFQPNVTQETWTLLQGVKEEVMRVGARPLPRGPLEAPPTYFFLLYISTYPRTIGDKAKNLIPPPQPSVSTRSHLGACSGAPAEGASITEGFYISSKPFRWSVSSLLQTYGSIASS